MKGKAKRIINRTVFQTESGFGLGWKCDICNAPFKSFKKVKKHKQKDHAYRFRRYRYDFAARVQPKNTFKLQASSKSDQTC